MSLEYNDMGKIFLERFVNVLKKILFIIILLIALLCGCKTIVNHENGKESSGFIQNKPNEKSDTDNKIVSITTKNKSEMYKTISGTSLSFIPLLDFSKAQGFVGYESLTYQICIMVMELPVPKGKNGIGFFDNMLTPELLQTKGLIYVSKEKNVFNTSSLLIKCKGSKDNKEYIQWVFLLDGNNSKFAQIQVSGPKDKFEKIENDILRMLSTFKWNEKVVKADTYYLIELPKGWKLAKQHGFLEIYSESGDFPLNEGESDICVMNMQKYVDKNERKEFIQEMNLQRNYYTNLNLLKSYDLVIDDFTANISYVSGYDLKASKNVILQYCYIFLYDTTILIEGDRTEILSKDVFENTVKSWRLKVNDF